MILASTAKGSNLKELLGEMADNEMEVISPSIAMVATPQTIRLGEIKAEVASLRRELSDLQATGQLRTNRRTRSQSHSPSESGVCWYHRHFRDSARKRTCPCAK